MFVGKLVAFVLFDCEPSHDMGVEFRAECIA